LAALLGYHVTLGAFALARRDDKPVLKRSP
jgi:hypothetical protein